MANGFEYFIVFADMRTGSNFLQENLNLFSGLRCFGELFNPHFIGGPKSFEAFGISMKERDDDPFLLIEQMKKQTDGLAGFRFFQDHDKRVMLHCLNDEKCAKVILNRNPLETYVSLGIARQTGQWRVGEGKNIRSTSIEFNPTEFSQHLTDIHNYQQELRKHLQRTGQTAFHLDYDDLRDVETLNGLAGFLGISDQIERISKKTVKQNPAPLSEKIINFSEMKTALSEMDFFGLNQVPSFEPKRGPAVPSFFAAARSPLLFAPIPGGPVEAVLDWMSGIDGALRDDLRTGFTQKTLRQWKRREKGHCSFSIVRHPVARLHASFVSRILLKGPETYSEIRETLRNTHQLGILKDAPDAQYDSSQHRAAFLKFIDFVKANLAGQTGVRVDSAWASQFEILQGFNRFMVLNHILREDQIDSGLAFIASAVEVSAPVLVGEPDNSPISLDQIYDDEIEAAIRGVYQRDYMMFGFDRWR